ncbi:MAG: hypothetical protein AAF681_09100 [Pseudomonadota bacterium]
MNTPLPQGLCIILRALPFDLRDLEGVDLYEFVNDITAFVEA